MTIEEDKQSHQQPEVFELKRQGRGFRASRRDFLKVAGSGLAAAALSSCVAQPEAGEMPTNTVTPPRTPTKTPTPTATRTPTPTPTKIPVTASVRTQGGRLRWGPSTETLVIGVLSANVVVTIIGKLADASWLQIQVNLTDLPSLKNAPIAKQGTTVVGWMRVDLLEILAESLDDVPVVEPPSTPTPLPNQKPTGKEGITYKYTDLYGNTHSYTLPCGAPIPAGAVCTCNCVTLCSCVGYVAPPCSCDKNKGGGGGGGGSVCTCNLVTYWYPN